jgi:hypothetical protein
MDVMFASTLMSWTPAGATIAACAAVIVLATPMIAAQPGAQRNAAAKSPAAATSDRDVPFHIGENLTYDVSYLSATVGTATLSVTEPKVPASDRAGYALMAEGQPGSLLQKVYPFYYKLESLLDTKKLLPIRASSYSRERGKVRTKTTTFSATGMAEYEIKTATVVHNKVQVDKLSQDPLSLVYVLRAFTVRQDSPITVPVTDGGTTYKVRVRNLGPQQIVTPAGAFSAWQLELAVIEENGKPTAASRKLMLWISSDARKLPVRFDSPLALGSLVLTLSHVGTKP